MAYANTNNVEGEHTPLLDKVQRAVMPVNEDQLPVPSTSTSVTVCSISEDSNATKTSTPFPWRPVTSIFLLAVVQPLGFEMIFPFVNQMIVENGIVNDPERVGFYSGVIESSFAIMSFIAVMPFSIMSDRVGRKPVILTGTAGLAVSIGLFGMCKTYWAMIVTRCLGGTLGGTWTAIKVMLAEVTDKSHQGMAFSGFLIAYRMGQIVGQPLGGLLTHPERSFGAFDTRFWRQYPFALPCFVASAFAILAVVSGLFSLDETLVSKRKKRSSGDDISSGTPAPTSTEDTASSEHAKGPVSFFSKSIMTKQFISVLINTVFLTLSSEMMYALFPLFAFTPIASGGLGLSEAEIGTSMAIRALNNVVVMFFYTPLHSRFGMLRTYQIMMMFWPISVVIFPMLNVMARRGAEGTLWFNFVVGVFYTVWSFAGVSWSSWGILVNDCAPSGEALATVNSICQMLYSLCLAVAPAFTTSLFAFSIKTDIAHGNLVWIVMFLIASFGAVHSLTLKEETHGWQGGVDKQGTLSE